MNSKIYIPWVEKYRPVNFKDIVLDNYNKNIFNNIIKTNYFPNILLYGPPGTGKTTTIINLINTFQINNNQKDKGLMIHLNASDERGIDIIRNQINSFVNSKTLFSCGIKFVILDEVDYMTKNAQQALKYLLQEYNINVRFCLICNYISRIDDSLQNEFVRLRFNQLPKYEIIDFLKKININENLYLTDKQIVSIQTNYKSDIRSMINYMQSNQLAIKNTKVMSNDIFNTITHLINNKKYKLFNNEINKMISTYNIDVKSIIIGYFNYIIRNKQENITPRLLNIMETIIHNSDCNINNIIKYFFYSLSTVIV
uniref:AAA+ ATPase domain-containing protein n=1 Tax=viral metagenome TaxID=1070528 RepID=A0A6C0AWW3_9ZZZZ|tara:strand:+ start:79919 stop:80854 length:936 start_codon:yes stop_codon:yes gene_type:complete